MGYNQREFVAQVVMISRIRAVAAVLLLSLVGCQQSAEEGPVLISSVLPECKETRGWFPDYPGRAPLDETNSADAAILSRFGGVCDKLEREPALGSGGAVYACDLYFRNYGGPRLASPGETPEEIAKMRVARLNAALGGFGPIQWDANERMLGDTRGFWGGGRTLLIVADAGGELRDVLKIQPDTSRLGVVTSASGAADLASLVIGKFDRHKLCQSRLLTMPDGWIFTDIPINCVPGRQEVVVAKTGALERRPASAPSSGGRQVSSGCAVE